MEKIKVYVYSAKVSTLGFVDKEGAQHACAQAGSSAFAGLQHYASMSDRYLSDNEKTAISVVKEFCRTRGNLEVEIMDLATEGHLMKTRFWLKGLRNFPAIAFGGIVIHGVPAEEDLEKLVTIAR